MSWKIDLALVPKKQQCSAFLVFGQCYWHQKKHGWRPLAGFPRFMKICFHYLWAEKWQRKWERQDPKTVPTTSSATLKEIDHTMYPNITECLQIFSTLPVTTCECERNVSALRRLKTYLWSPMSKARLSGLALLHFHCNMEIDFNEIIRIFLRKLELANTLSAWLKSQERAL